MTFLWLCLRYRVRPATVDRAIANWLWRMRSVGAADDEAASLLVLWLESGGRRALVELAAGPRVPATWWDE